MFFLYSYGSGSPLMARKTAPILTLLLVLMIAIAVIMLVGILVRKNSTRKSSSKFIEKEKNRPTKYQDILKFSKENALSPVEKNILWNVCQVTQWKNISYSLKDNASVNELFREGYFKIKEKNDWNDKKLNCFFKTLFKIETIVAQYKKLISSKQIPIHSTVFYISSDGEQYPFTVIENTKDYFAIEVPDFIAKSKRKPELLTQSRFTYRTNDGLSHNFITRFLRYDESNPKQIKGIIAHTDKLECQTLRKYKREFVDVKCLFSAVSQSSSGEKTKYSVKPEKLEGKLMNISGGGCCIQTHLPIKQKQLLGIYLDVIGIEPMLIGIIRMTRKLPNGNFSLHIQFLDLNVSVENKILTMVYKYEL